MGKAFGKSVSGKACECEEKNKDNWTIIGYTGRRKDGYVVTCSKCRNQWNTKAQYAKELKKASWLIKKSE